MTGEGTSGTPSASHAYRMSLLFISHSSRDNEPAGRLAQALSARGVRSVFLDFDPEHGIPAGRDWKRELYTQLRRADAVVFLGSEASNASRWCFAEIALAQAIDKPIFPIAIEANGRHSLLDSVQWINGRMDDEQVVDRLLDGLRRYGLDALDSFGWDPERPPYPGLESFDERDSAVFFGREAALTRLAEFFRPTLQRGAGGVVAVVGPSGSGKSSLVRAGLVPRLKHLADRWLVLPAFVPGDQPTANLARVLAIAQRETRLARAHRDVLDELWSGPAALVGLVRDLCDATAARPGSVLLIVDQAEELITRTASAERDAFLQLLRRSVGPDSPLWVVATLRSEFLSSSTEHAGFADVLDETLLLEPLARTRLPEVIIKPAAKVGTSFAPGLVERIVDETVGGDAMPLLAYTLSRLYERSGPDAVVTAADYDAVGGVVGALRSQADGALRILDRSGRADLVLRTLIKLVTIGPDGQPGRRRVPRAALDASENEVVQAFVDAHLLVSRTDAGEVVVEVAHEALFRQWTPLAEVIASRRDSLRMHANLERQAQDWDRAGRGPSFLIGGERLDAAQRWAGGEDAPGTSAPLIAEFLDESARRDLARLERESDLLANRVLAGFPDDPELGILLALAAIEHYAATPRAILALTSAMAASPLRLILRGHEQAINRVAWSPDGSRVVTAADHTATVWDARSGARLLVLSGHGNEVRSADWSPDGARIATASADGTARIWDAVSGTTLASLSGHDAEVRDVAWSPDGSRLATASADLTARIWAADRVERLVTLRGHESWVEHVSWSPDGTRVATASSDGSGRIWDSASGKEVLLYRFGPYMAGFEEGVNALVWSPDGYSLASAEDETQAKILSAEDGTERAVLRGHDTNVVTVDWSPDSGRLVTGAHDRTARIWDRHSGHEVQRLVGHRGSVSGVAWSPDGGWIASASLDGTARLWKPDPDVMSLRGHDRRVSAVSWSPRGDRIVTGAEDGTIRVWAADTGTALFAAVAAEAPPESMNGAKIEHLLFGPDGTRLVTVPRSGTAKMWSVDTGEVLFVLGDQGAWVETAAWSPDGGRVVTGARNGTLTVWDAATGRRLSTGQVNNANLDDVGWSPDGSRVVTASTDRTAQVWEAETARPVLVLGEHSLRVHKASFSPDGSRIATVPYDGLVKIWEAATGEELLVFEGHRKVVHALAWAPDSDRIATASEDGTAQIWDPATGERLHLLRFGNQVFSATWSADGARLLTTAFDGTATVWNAQSGEPLLVMAHGRKEWVLAAAWSPDESRAATITHARFARVWDTVTEPELLAAKARGRVFRELTDEERREHHL
jgi:WD40 repeat protein